MLQPIKVNVKRLPHCHDLPRYATSGSSGLDLTAAVRKPITINPGKRVSVPTGLIVEIPTGYEGQIRPRSGLAARFGITLTNCVGTIDSDYRGEVIVLLINLGDRAYSIEPAERIAQLVVVPYPRVEIVEVDDIPASDERGAGGFGSTGRSAFSFQSTSIGLAASSEIT